MAIPQPHFVGQGHPSGKRDGTFETHLRSLIDDKYNREYKLDKKTRSKALEILHDFFAKNQSQANVSGFHFDLNWAKRPIR